MVESVLEKGEDFTPFSFGAAPTANKLSNNLSRYFDCARNIEVSKIISAVPVWAEVYSSIISSRRSPVVVLSTGRCGTLALQEFLEGSDQLHPVHRNLFFVSSSSALEWQSYSRNETFYRISNGIINPSSISLDVLSVFQLLFPELEAAEVAGKRLVIVMHGWSMYWPVLSVIFPGLKCLNIDRDSRKVARSFWLKGQFTFHQISPRSVKKLSSPPYLVCDPDPEMARAFGERLADQSALKIFLFRLGKKFVFQLASIRYHFLQLYSIFGSNKFLLRGSGSRSKGRLGLNNFFMPKTLKCICWYIYVQTLFNRLAGSFLQPSQYEHLDADQVFACSLDSYEKIMKIVGCSDLSYSDYRKSYAKPVNSKKNLASQGNLAIDKMIEEVPIYISRLSSGDY